MMWYYGNMMGGWAWFWMLPMMLLFWGAILALVVYVVRGLGSPRPDDAALATLRSRLASGAITQEEFEKTRKLLQG